MWDAHGPRRRKWALEWPMTIPDSTVVNDGVPARSSSLKTELIVLAGAIGLALALVAFHAALGS
jgi:hypothetical protein